MRKWRNVFITVFVILWTAAFHYESIRFFYLERWAGHSLPKIKFLFPPAGWIMFFNVDESYGHVQVFGLKDDKIFEIDPHDIFRVRTIGFDNIHRGVIGAAASRHNRPAFCRHLSKAFPEFDQFKVISTYYPSFVSQPLDKYNQLLYTCTAEGQLL